MKEESSGSLSARFRGARHDPALVVLEGLHALKHAQRFAAELIQVCLSDRIQATSLARALAPDLLPVIESATELDAASFAQLAPVAHATGVIALARRPHVQPELALRERRNRPVVLLERPSHLANIGAAVRVAAAADAAALFSLAGEDPWRPAAIRGGAGLQYALPCCRIEALPPSDRPLIALDPEGDPIDRSTLPANAIYAFGSERTGLSRELLETATTRVRIPMRDGVSSLNLATAVAVVLYSLPPA